MSLEKIVEVLRRERRDLASPYLVPGLWVDFQSEAAQSVNPYDFYADRVEAISNADPIPVVTDPDGINWTRYAITYNLFPRLTTSFDHNNANGLELNPIEAGWRETGTLLKCICLLPYIHSMGFNTIHLLPITAIGVDGRKGTLGSPYAIRNPYRLDDNLTEPGLPELDAMTLFKAFVEGAHRLGMRVVMEFVLRTASKDSDWVKEHPEWFYWIRADIPDRKDRNPNHFGPPIFDWEAANRIYDRVGRGERHDLPKPPKMYRDMFTAPPRAETVHMHEGRWYGVVDDGTHVRIPGAFTDWPLDSNQPLWTDVTYLRLYTHPDFNYMAYDTLRMYDAGLAREENVIHDLWDAIAGILPYYQHECHIDGAMIDMGHSLPRDLKLRMMQRAREINPEFAFWSEDFNASHYAREEGYNAVMGHLFFDLHQPEKMQGYIDWLAWNESPITIFLTPENHNTPRAATRENALGFCHQALLYMVALPGMPWVCTGFELFEKTPINTGLNFSPEDLDRFEPAKLPLFSEGVLHWTRQGNMVGAIRYANHLRQKYHHMLSDPNPETTITGSSDNPNILVFGRRKESRLLIFAFNMTMWDHQSGEAEIYASDYVAHGLWGFDGSTLLSDRVSVHVDLGGGHSIMIEADNVV